MTLHIREREPAPEATLLGAQYIFSESDGPRYETATRDEEVVDSRLVMSPELVRFRQLSHYWSDPSSTPISASLTGAGDMVNQRLSAWGVATTATVAPFEHQESPLSSWPVLDACRRGWGSLPPRMLWSRFLARLPLLTVAEAPASDPVRAGQGLGVAKTDLPTPDDVMAAIDEVQATLGLTTKELSVATGVGLRTLRGWHALDVRPRHHTARAVWRLFVTAHALRRGLGSHGVSGWLRAGAPSPMDVLTSGDLTTFEGLARIRLLVRERELRLCSGFAEDQDAEGAPMVQQLRRAARRPSRGRLGAT